MKILTERFKEVLEKKSLTIYDAEKISNVSVCMIGRIFSVGEVPIARKLANICAGLDVSAEYLLGLKDENTGANGCKVYENHYECLAMIKSRILVLIGNNRKPAEVSDEFGIPRWRAVRLIKSSWATMDDLMMLREHYNVSLDWLLGLQDTEN